MLTGMILVGKPEVQAGDGQMTALLPYKGEPLIQTQIKEMRDICDEIIVVTPDPRPLLKILEPTVRIITDYHKGKGPLGGMYAGLSLAAHKEVWTVGGDMPFLSANAAQVLLEYKGESFQAAIPYIEGIKYPLHGIYDKSCAAQILKLFDLGKTRTSSLLSRIRRTDVSERAFEERGIHLEFVKAINNWRAASEAPQPVVHLMNGGLT